MLASHLSNWGECFLVVLVLDLGATYGDKTGLKAKYVTFIIALDFVDSFRTNGLATLWDSNDVVGP